MTAEPQTPGVPCPAASFVLVGFAMRPEAVTELLEIEATQSNVSVVRNCATNRKEECGLWSYDTGRHISSDDLGEHIEHLLGLFRPLKSRLEEIAPRPNAFMHVRCAPWKSHSLTRIDARHVAGIAELGAALRFEVLNLGK